MLRLDGIAAGYGRVPVLEDMTLTLARGETLAVAGPNGAGKSTLLKVIAGSVKATSGEILDGQETITHLPVRKRVAGGIVLCPEGRRIFSSLSIEENLKIGATGAALAPGTSARRQCANDLEKIYAMFPLLKERRANSGGALSGGQQQMLAIGRALMARPRILLLDEPSLGLSPIMADEIYAILARLREEDLSMVVVEEAAGRPLELADRGILLRRGRIVRNETAATLLATTDFNADYLGHSE